MFALNVARKGISSRLCQFQIEDLKMILFPREQVKITAKNELRIV